MRTPQQELEILRVGVARVAQAIGLDSTDVPGRPTTWAYELLVRAAKTERGWNALCAKIVSTIHELRAARG